MKHGTRTSYPHIHGIHKREKKERSKERREKTTTTQTAYKGGQLLGEHGGQLFD
jgi:hypothetical protein